MILDENVRFFPDREQEPIESDDEFRLLVRTDSEDACRLLVRTDSEDGCSVRRNAFHTRTLLENKLFVITAILVVIVVGLMITLVITNRENYLNLKSKAAGNNGCEMNVAGNNETEICCTSPCMKGASNLMKSMDLTVDPCTDFYSFVCGNWIKNVSLTSSKESQITKMEATIKLRVKEILEDLINEEYLPEHKRKVANFYRACMNKIHRDERQADEFLSDLEKFGGWPLIKEDWNPSTFNWSNLMVDLFKNGYNNDMLFRIKVDIDITNTSRSLISVRSPTLGLKYKTYYEQNGITYYRKILFKLAKLLKYDLDEEKSMAAIEDAYKIENDLAGISQDLYHITTLEELEKSASMIPWRKILQDLLPYDTELSDKEHIEVVVPSVLKALNGILKKLSSSDDGKKALANYMFYRTIFDVSQYLGRDLFTLISNFWNKDEEYASRRECAELTMDSFPLSLAASYVTKYVDNTTKHLLEGIFDDLRRTLLDDIIKSRWLDYETKAYALLKVRKMRSLLAYPDEIMDDETLNDFYKDVTITDDHFKNVKQVNVFMLNKSMEGLHDVQERFSWHTVNNLLQANAYYYPSRNSILILVGYLQDPLFVPGRPNYMTYGSLGRTVGHEMTHAFDTIGGLYDAEGNRRRWWSPHSLMKFQERTKCFKDQYSKYYVPAAGTYINGTHSLAENMADNGGLHTAYKAYMKLLERTGPEKLLPGLPYTAKQLFWISFALVFCEKDTDEGIRAAMSNKYASAQFRVIGSLSNMEEFARDFNCKLNSTMNPQSKCSLWE